MGDLTEAGDLLEFSFESALAEQVPEAALLRLVRQAAAFNGRSRLTGRLRFEDGRFAQVLEGRAALLLPLAGRILADRRHGSIRITGFGALAARRFCGWTATGFDLGDAVMTGDNLHFMPARPEVWRPASVAAVLAIGGRHQASALPDA